MLRQVARGGVACVRPALNYVVTPEEFKLLNIASIALRAVCDESLAHLGTLLGTQGAWGNNGVGSGVARRFEIARLCTTTMYAVSDHLR